MPSTPFFPLIVFGNAYQHPLVMDLVKSISKEYDVLEFGNFPEKNMLKAAVSFFKSQKKYTHFSYIAPDLHVRVRDIDYLRTDIRMMNPEIISACCNVDNKASRDMISCCYRLPTYNFETRHYKWLAESQRQTHIDKNMAIENMGFSGMALCMIRRDLLERVDLFRCIPELSYQSRWDDPLYGWAWDLNLSHWLKRLDVPNYVDLSVKLDHDRNEYESQVGKQNPYIKYTTGITTHMLKCNDDR